ncbi:glycerophosphodiester phosphodiesterase 1-like [Ptychodera flava]|uniref:glycerophosphodiester phosphodiesterase 1-like n=1 Tax=Ptychodera flava TaxID=63121 RepID=UPI003969C333
MAAPLPSPVHTALISAVLDLSGVFLITFVTAHFVLPVSSTKHLFTGLCSVVLVFAVIHGFRIPPVDRSASDKVLEPNRMLVIGHRGGAYDAPENTIEAIREAKKNGADGVELDLEFTKDGVPVLLHDSSVDRTTDGQGEIKSYTFEEIRKLNASHGHRLSAQFSKTRIPTLQEATEECLRLGLKIFYDVKGNAQQAAEALVKLFHEHPKLYESAAVCSFYPEVIYKVRLNDQKIVTALTHRSGDLAYSITGEPRDMPAWKVPLAHMADLLTHWAHHSFLWYFCGNSAFLLWKNEMSQQVKVYWEHRGIQVITWTVNSAHEKMYNEKYLKTSYITDSLIGDCEQSKS